MPMPINKAEQFESLPREKPVSTAGQFQTVYSASGVASVAHLISATPVLSTKQDVTQERPNTKEIMQKTANSSGISQIRINSRLA